MKLTYDYMDKEVQIGTVKSSYGEGYFMAEQIKGSGDEPQVLAGPYLTKRDALIAGEKYVLSIIGEEDI